MAFSSSVSRFCGSHIFASFYEPDVSNIFISHFRKQLEENLIFMFDNQEMKGSPTIAHALTQGIRESRISIVVLSKNYASSSWCLDELVEILKCKEDMRQIVMTVFYGVDPSHVRKSTGDFGIAFDETCAQKPEESRRIWNQALNDVGNIAGEVRENWADESEMIAKIVRSVSNELHGNWLDLGVGKGTIITKGDKNVWQRKKKRGVNFPSTEPSISTKSRYSIGRVFLVVIINLLLEIASAVADQLSSFRKPYFARISLVMSILSLILSILDFTYKIRADKARFRCKWPMPWFYYPSRGYNRIFGSSTDAILLFCGVGSFIVSTINFSFTGRGRDGPIKVSVWPLVFSVGMVVSKIMEKSPQSEELV